MPSRLLREGATRTGRRRAAARALIVLLAFGVAPARAETHACGPWPGEPTPLATTASADAFLARWAALRAADLSTAAQAAEVSAPARALRLWDHVRCLDPSSSEALAGADRLRAVRVHRPDVVAVRTAPRPDATSALAHLDTIIRVVPALAAPPSSVARVPAPAPPATPAPPDWKRADDMLGAAESQLRDANFEAALATAERARRQLASQPTAAGARQRQARAEVAAATAEIALGRDDAARKSFERALAADPKLTLDPATTSPKVRRAFDAARGAKGGTP